MTTKTKQTSTIPAAVCIREIRAAYVADAPERGDVIRDAATTASLINRLFDLETDPQENVVALYLDGKNRVISCERVYRGTSNAATVGTRDIVRNALLQNAAAVVVSHNHPSGDPAPSAEDIAWTRKLIEATRLFSIDLLDHIVLGHGGRYVSLQNRGII